MNGSYGRAQWLLAAGWIAISLAAHAQEASMTLDQVLPAPGSTLQESWLLKTKFVKPAVA